jgi:hypothetical protein
MSALLPMWALQPHLDSGHLGMFVFFGELVAATGAGLLLWRYTRTARWYLRFPTLLTGYALFNLMTMMAGEYFSPYRNEDWDYITLLLKEEIVVGSVLGALLLAANFGIRRSSSTKRSTLDQSIQ